ncbi:HIT family protein [bacterium SCSIO 12741]|nr:HIT family protein [bacterium SCSIO 12741]
MSSIFSRIIAGEIPCYKIAETENCFAFLDIFPLKAGHLLIVPKQEVDELFDLDEDIYTELQQFARTIGIALKKAVPCTRIGTAVVGLEVPHAHIHLIPIDRMKDMDFAQDKLQFSPEEFEAIAASIRNHL